MSTLPARPSSPPAKRRRQAGKTEARQKPKRRTTTIVRDGRAPLAFGRAIEMMTTERGMVAPAAGGSILAQFEACLAAVAPELAGHIQAVKFDADTAAGTLSPTPPAYGTRVHCMAPRLLRPPTARFPKRPFGPCTFRHPPPPCHHLGDVFGGR
ncbi:hypothetical protein [Streptomyces lavendulocolor]|uniref:hypothetical protein n=1 Tax=Streptomyces lavendulocolor TaxID=67316 RepID=UPI003C2B8F93